jgi:hypothetical protein
VENCAANSIRILAHAARVLVLFPGSACKHAGGATMTANTWQTGTPPKHRHVWAWWGVVEVRAFWTGKVWRDVATYAVLRDVTHWREDCNA